MWRQELRANRAGRITEAITSDYKQCYTDVPVNTIILASLADPTSGPGLGRLLATSPKEAAWLVHLSASGLIEALAPFSE